MKTKLLMTTAILALASTPLFAAECATIQDGTILNSANEPIPLGYNDAGYNYQAHIFNGPYYDSDLIMKWNEAWLSNMDCDGDNKLDRHRGYPGYKDSGAWLTNHQTGTVDVNGKPRKWTYEIKIVAVNSDDTLVNGIWVRPDGSQVGPVIWGDFAIIQEVYNDPSTGAHGLLYKAPVGPGLGEGHIQ